jgi:hypothetical protein
MKRVALFLALALPPIVLIACSAMLRVTVFNNTGGTIEVYTERNTGKIEPGKYDDFRYPSRAGEAGVFELLRIAGDRCEYLYDLDRAHYPAEEWNRGVVAAGRGIQVQVEKDFSIDLLSADYTGNGPAPSETIPKREGFPLRPFTKKCR